MRVRELLVAVKLGLLCAGAANAHASDQSFVLLLPTAAYTSAGVAAVVLTVLALFVLPPRVVTTIFTARPLRRLRGPAARQPLAGAALADAPAAPGSPAPMAGSLLSALACVLSLLSFAVMVFAIYVGLNGPRDPLSNLLPLTMWTLGWIGAVSLSGILGNFWQWLNPWTGLIRLIRLIGPKAPPLRLPSWLGHWPATTLLLGFSVFLLIDIAPNDPRRLARLAGLYWAVNLAGIWLFGRDWLHRVELCHATMAAYARLVALRWDRAGDTHGRVGVPGWHVMQGPGRAEGIFALTLLGVGSFDGLNETFWWLGQIGVNPLEFPGRSAVMVPNLTGLVGMILGLWGIFAVTVWMGARLTGGVDLRLAINWLALSLLPIAFAYHVAHYLTSFLVTIQYSWAALSDPFANGTDLLGIQPFYVTTGFFNRIDSVRVIWLTQAGVVVLGHVWSVVLSHRIALALHSDARRAAWLTAPLSVFMIAYTLLGLWLLAAPRAG